MNKNWILFILFSFNLSVIAQVKPIYLNGNQIVSDPNKATSYGVFGKISNEDIWVLKRYNLYDELMSTGSFKDASLTIEHGDFVFYSYVQDFNDEYLTHFSIKDKSRFIAQKGKFDNGLETGEWIWYFPTGSVMTILTYEKGVKNGPFYNYDRNGNVIQSGKYLNGEKEGEWLYNRGKDREFYVKGIPQEESKKQIQSKASGTIN